MPENICNLVSFLLIVSSTSFDDKKLGNVGSLRTEVNGLPLLNFNGSTRLHLTEFRRERRWSGKEKARGEEGEGEEEKAIEEEME